MSDLPESRKLLLKGVWTGSIAGTLRPLQGTWVKIVTGIPDRYVDVVLTAIQKFYIILRPGEGWTYECQFLCIRPIAPESQPRNDEEAEIWVVQVIGTGVSLKDPPPG